MFTFIIIASVIIIGLVLWYVCFINTGVVESIAPPLKKDIYVDEFGAMFMDAERTIYKLDIFSEFSGDDSSSDNVLLDREKPR